MAASNADVHRHDTVKHGRSAGYSHAVAHAPSRPAPSYKPTPLYYPAPAIKSAPVYKPAPSNKPAPSYHAPKYAPSYHEPANADVQAKYQYEYAVANEYAGVNFCGNKARDGCSTYGEYRVVFPDCPTQHLKYNTADSYSGNISKVKYSGEPCYDTYKPVHKRRVYHALSPAYKPAPHLA